MEYHKNCLIYDIYFSDPSKHTTSFRCPYNVHNVKTTSYGYQNNVVCVGYYIIYGVFQNSLCCTFRFQETKAFTFSKKIFQGMREAWYWAYVTQTTIG